METNFRTSSVNTAPIRQLSPPPVSAAAEGADLLAISPVTTPASRHPSIFDAASSLGAPNMFSDSAVSSRGHSPQPLQPQPQQQQANQSSTHSASRLRLAEEVAQVLLLVVLLYALLRGMMHFGGRISLFRRVIVGNRQISR